MTDVLLCQSNDGGEIESENGTITLTDSFETAAYLSLFGGNVDGTTWWGNRLETDPARQLTSRTEQALATIPPIPFNLPRIEQAVRADLQWLLDLPSASNINVEVGLPAVNKVSIAITISAVGSEQRFEYTENWRSTD